MTDTTNDPIAERMERIRDELAHPFHALDGAALDRTHVDLAALLAFARDVLKITDPDTGRILADAALDDIRDAADRHLGGDS